MSQLDDQFDLDIRMTPLGRSRTDDPRLVAETVGGSAIPSTRVAATPVRAARSRPATSSWRTAGSRSPSPGTTAKTRATAAATPGAGPVPISDDGETGTLRVPHAGPVSLTIAVDTARRLSPHAVEAAVAKRRGRPTTPASPTGAPPGCGEGTPGWRCWPPPWMPLSPDVVGTASASIICVARSVAWRRSNLQQSDWLGSRAWPRRRRCCPVTARVTTRC